MTSSYLDYANKSASAEETLTNVLGLPSTLPRWAEREIDLVVQQHLKGSMSVGDFRSLEDDLVSRGLRSHFSEALKAVTESNDERT